MDDQLLNQIGTRVQVVKVVLNLRNTDLAYVAGITSQAVADIMAGKVRYPKANVIVAWARAYQLSYDWLLEGKGTLYRADEPAGVPLPVWQLVTDELRHQQHGGLSGRSTDSQPTLPASLLSLLTDELRHRHEFMTQLVGQISQLNPASNADGARVSD